jgi:hypothetical protein
MPGITIIIIMLPNATHVQTGRSQLTFCHSLAHCTVRYGRLLPQLTSHMLLRSTSGAVTALASAVKAAALQLATKKAKSGATLTP